MNQTRTFILCTMLALLPLWGACSTTQANDPDQDKVQFSPPQGEKKIEEVKIPKGAPLVQGSADPSGERVVTRAAVNEMLGQGPAWGLRQVQVEPHKDGDSKFLGFRVIKLTPAATGALAPLQVGDVVTHLNGVKLKRPEDYMDAWALARDIAELRLDYLHKGEATFVAWRVE